MPRAWEHRQSLRAEPSRETLRAKHLRRRPLEPAIEDPYATAQVFDEACRDSGMTNEQVAAFVGVDTSIISEMRRAERVLTAPRIQRLPPALAIAVLRRLLRLFGE